MVTPAAVVARARAYLGVRFAHQGRTRAGMDCAGLIVRVTADLGIPVGDLTGYGRTPNGGRLQEHMDAQGLAGADVVTGAVALMRFESEPQHVAVIGDYLGGHSLIHALAASRQVVEHRLDQMWKSRIVAVYRIPGVEY